MTDGATILEAQATGSTVQTTLHWTVTSHSKLENMELFTKHNHYINFILDD